MIAARNLSQNHTPSRTIGTIYGDKAFLLANHSVLTKKIHVAARQVPRIYLEGQKYTEIFLEKWKMWKYASSE